MVLGQVPTYFSITGTPYCVNLMQQFVIQMAHCFDTLSQIIPRTLGGALPPKHCQEFQVQILCASNLNSGVTPLHWSNGLKRHTHNSGEIGAQIPIGCTEVGLDAAGKTTILYKLKLGEIVTTIPTIVTTTVPCGNGPINTLSIRVEIKYTLPSIWLSGILGNVLINTDYFLNKNQPKHLINICQNRFGFTWYSIDIFMKAFKKVPKKFLSILLIVAHEPGRVEKDYGKTTLSTSDQDSSLNLPVIGSLVCYKSSALDNVATEEGCNAV
uniref:Uncharacterized protein n=1 Tax=Timema genevievae TaxID=629358 RepID=A0A7R9PHJ5_TIMGE|nr:unnamed protein product [Timema genevievae]